jgi:hypothetical protein
MNGIYQAQTSQVIPPGALRQEVPKESKEPPINVAEKRIDGAFGSLTIAFDRLDRTLVPIISQAPGTLATPEKSPPCTQFERIIDKTVDGIEFFAKRVHDICDRSVI